MTLNKAISELFAELDNPNLTEEEKKALKKYEMWLLGIKGTVSNNTELMGEGGKNYQKEVHHDCPTCKYFHSMTDACSSCIISIDTNPPIIEYTKWEEKHD